MTTKPTEAAVDAGPAFPRGAALVRRLFDHLGVPKRGRVARLQELTEWTYPTAYRRLTGESSWTVDELERLAEQCGMSLSSLLSLDEDEGTKPGVFVFGSSRIRCRVTLDGPTEPDRPYELVALQEEAGWVVLAPSGAGAAPTYAVKRVVLLPETRDVRARVAVVDDLPEVTGPLCEALRLQGFNALPFASFEQLSEALRSDRFDAYILDWLIGPKSAAALIAEIRSLDPQCPIAVLTGQLRAGEIDQDEVAAAVAQHQTLFFEKPAPTAIIAAQLKQRLQALKAASAERTPGAA